MLPVIKQRRMGEFSLGALFFLLTLFLSVPYCGAVTIEALYVDTPGTGFNDHDQVNGREKGSVRR